LAHDSKHGNNLTCVRAERWSLLREPHSHLRCDREPLGLPEPTGHAVPSGENLGHHISNSPQVIERAKFARFDPRNTTAANSLISNGVSFGARLGSNRRRQAVPPSSSLAVLRAAR
jgi:hypothetical protein